MVAIMTALNDPRKLLHHCSPVYITNEALLKGLSEHPLKRIYNFKGLRYNRGSVDINHSFLIPLEGYRIGQGAVIRYCR